MAYPPLAISRRNRRRRRLALLIALAVVLGVVALAVRYRTERRDAMDYLALAKEVTEVEAELATSLGDLFTSLGTVERPALLARLDEMRTTAAEQRMRLDEATVPRAVAEAHGFLAVATGSWSDALGAIETAIMRILDDAEDDTAASVLDNAFDLLRVGDVAYAGFLASVDAMDQDLVTREYGPVAFVGDERRLLYDGKVLAERITLFRALGERHDIKVTATTSPEPLGGQDGFPIVPYTEDFAVRAVITNVGNEPEALIPVALELTSRSGDGAVQERNITIESLGPGEATTVEFDSLEVPAGSLYELVVRSEIRDDTDPENNLFRLVFFRNEET